MTKIVIVGGSKDRLSSVIEKLHAVLSKKQDNVTTFNSILPTTGIKEYDLTLWMPDISNEEEKDYPVKKQGSILICSKVMRKETARIDAVSRIFMMRGNAVIMIHKNKKPFSFELVDALNNTWCKTSNLEELASKIMELYLWTKASVRRSLEEVKDRNTLWVPDYDKKNLSNFIEINKKLALKVANGCGNRFFGNFSTRCTKLFPSHKILPAAFFFSPRNTNKQLISTDDLVLCDYDKYYGECKPSVDTPVQLKLYRNLPGINYMIHGHAYIKDAITTLDYYPCGDMREVVGILEVVDSNAVTRINLKNHGFLLLSQDIKGMERHLNECKFKMIGE